MIENDIIESVWNKLITLNFTGQTFSNGPGLKVEFKRNNIMKIQGGNLKLPNSVFLQLGTSPKLVFDENVYIDEKKLYKDHPEEILKIIENIREYGKKIEQDWMILKLLDPRILLKKRNYTVLGMKETKKNLIITLAYDIEKLRKNKDIPISSEFLTYLKKMHLLKRGAAIYVDHNNNLIKIIQNEIIIPSKHVSINFNFTTENIIQETPIPA